MSSWYEEPSDEDAESVTRYKLIPEGALWCRIAKAEVADTMVFVPSKEFLVGVLREALQDKACPNPEPNSDPKTS